MQGFINVYKPIGMSSAKVVAQIKHGFKLDKVGHMGTLDPLACGILPIAVGKATRMFDYFLNKTKTYITIFKFGATTDTLDLGSAECEFCDNIPSKFLIENEIKNFVGKLHQTPPIYSAKNINGEKAYKLARLGKEVNLNSKEIEIFKYELIEQIDKNQFKFKIKCSSGTYIRSLAYDLAKNLNSLAYVTYLERTESDSFNLSNCISLDKLLTSNIKDYILNYENVFCNFEIINADEVLYTKLKNGLNLNFMHNDKIVFVKYKNEILGVAEIKNNIIKLKTFLLDN